MADQNNLVNYGDQINNVDKSIGTLNQTINKNSQTTKIQANEANIAAETFSMFTLSLRGAGKACEEFRKAVQAVIANLDNICAAIKTVSDIGVEFAGKMTATLGDGVSGAVDKVGDSIGGMGAKISKVGDGVKDLGDGAANFGKGLGSVGGGIKDIGGGLGDFASGLGDSCTAMTGLATALPAAAKGFMEMCVALDGVTAYIPQIAVFGAALFGLSKIGSDLIPAAEALATIGGGMTEIAAALGTFAAGLNSSVAAVAALIPLLPALGEAMLQMAVNMSGIMDYLGDLLIFVGILIILSLLGEGLMMAGTGLLNIGLGLTAMTEGLMAVIAFMPVFIASLADITSNVGGIILFVLLAAAMLVMAIAMEKINEQMTAFVESMTKLSGLMSVGFVAAFVVFGAMLIAMSFFMEKVASGIQKITDAMTKQCAKLAILNPLLAAQAILSNPIMGVVTVALAVAGGLLVKSLLPAMATGGVISSPTVAMVGEGRYPEAVVPLGDSPQFAGMKADIANAVIAAMGAAGGGANSGGRPIELTVNLDGKTLAKQIYTPLEIERGRRG
ncbi:MAG: hypothetical protein LBL66_10515 [Clostridiales bacterium]|jgi:uncharacterized membrane protein YciS (DUF1049 family)|nr:hypothetical protein [Clostridiales bacterium]